MANQKKFKDPVIVQMRVEREVKEFIVERYGNITDFVNKAIGKAIHDSKLTIKG